jgi:DHA1 family inner membrane transport protein
VIVPILILTAVAYSLTNSFINPILVEVARTFHVPVGVAGQGRTVLSAAGALAAFAATFLADRIPRRRQLLFGVGALGLAHVGMGLTHTFVLWLILQALAGVGSAIVGLAGTASAGDYFDEPTRGVAMGWITTGYPIAWIIGLPLIGWIADGWGWRASYLVAGGGLAAAAFLSVLIGLPAPRHHSASLTHHVAGWRVLLAQPTARGWVLGELLSTTAWSGFLVYVGAFFALTYGLAPGRIGLVVSAAALSSVVGTMSSGWVGNRWGRRPVLLVSTLLAAVLIVPALGLRLSPLGSLMLILPYYFINSIRFPTSGTIALSLLPAAPGTMMAARGLTITTGGMAGAILGGLLLELSGFRAVGIAYALLALAGCAVFWRWIPPETSAPVLRLQREPGS